MATNSALENYTIVAADSQLNGRGQQGSGWESEPYKNLIFSTFVSFRDLAVANKKYLNFAVSLAIYEALIAENIPLVSIKWPNDILSGNKKICGVLIENSLKGANISSSIIGIGLNVNQTIFSESLKKASSLKLISGVDFNLDELLKKIIAKLQLKITMLNAKDFNALEVAYLNVLYKKNIPTMFKNSNDVLFMGIIRGISNSGKIQIELDDETTEEFGIKEVSFL